RQRARELAVESLEVARGGVGVAGLGGFLVTALPPPAPELVARESGVLHERGLSRPPVVVVEHVIHVEDEEQARVGGGGCTHRPSSSRDANPSIARCRASVWGMPSTYSNQWAVRPADRAPATLAKVSSARKAFAASTPYCARARSKSAAE